MTRFQPTTQHPGFNHQYDGVLIVEFDDGDMAALTADRGKAETAVAAHLRKQHGIDDETELRDELAELVPQWVVFEWQPEDPESAWLMKIADRDADQALHVHYLPAA
ncbi:hypothetical protein [Streptomyces sp. NPDC050121]|uniref:hypothetical protein n=1 Tax=Streptomyces sp. NPDC050121 TaxID=3365601 RepID=UPI0037B9C47C